jgi:tRNA threonylcarbamoyladenosine biosynthesis protein TsaE
MKKTHFTITEPDDLLIVAQSVIRRLQPGNHIGLSGPLGAGKTTLVQHLAQALGITSAVDSPTFTLRGTHWLPSGGAFDALIHYDFYRLETREALAETGFFDDWNRIENLLIIEWIDRFPELASAIALRITIAVEHETGARQIVIEEKA